MIKQNIMKNSLRLIATLALAAMPLFASAQKKADPEGYLTYSLPSTVISIDVEAALSSSCKFESASEVRRIVHHIRLFITACTGFPHSMSGIHIENTK